VDLTDRVDAENVRARAKLDRLAHRVDVRDHPARLLILTAAAVASTGQASVGMSRPSIRDDATLSERSNVSRHAPTLRRSQAAAIVGMAFRER
jgi:hypothetical protein